MAGHGLTEQIDVEFFDSVPALDIHVLFHHDGRSSLTLSDVMRRSVAAGLVFEGLYEGRTRMRAAGPRAARTFRGAPTTSPAGRRRRPADSTEHGEVQRMLTAVHDDRTTGAP